MSKLLLVPLEDLVVFPNMNVTLTVDVGDEERVLLVPQHENDYASVGTVAEVTDRVRLPGGGRAVALNGLHRGVAGAAEHRRAAAACASRSRSGPTRRRPPPARASSSASTAPSSRRSSSCAATTAGSPPSSARSPSPARWPTRPATRPTSRFEQKVELLETVDVERAPASSRSSCQRERLAEMQVRRRIRDDVEEGAAKQQREYILRRQMESIRKELGEDDASVVEEYRHEDRRGRHARGGARAGRARARPARAPGRELARGVDDPQLPRLAARRAVGRSAPRSGSTRTHTREVLDADHAGLEDVKDRIVEYIAVRKLREERGIEPDKQSGAILTLVGPPGTGKTSIGESIARALGREFVRMSLGGVRDEAEIRGHRRTYIGALPGRLVRALRDAGTMNPVILLDEVDKVGADWRGDPSAALLEVLDPAQNHSFRDHYLDVELDLSEVVFIATANVADTIPGPLLDRMEVIRFDGYTTDEKIAIARGYLWPRQRERNGLREDEVSIADVVLETVISDYTREAGVRQLERELGKLLRKTATRIASGEGRGAGRARRSSAVRDALGRQKFFREAAERTAVPGVATGLAVTGTGGDVLFVEATAAKGDEQLVLTGQLGDVMKESAQIALSLAALAGRASSASTRTRSSADVPRARAGRRDPEGRAERRHHDGDRARVAALRPAGASTRSA